VAKRYRRGVERVRQHACTRLPQAVSAEADGQGTGARWALRKSEEQ
jgi:hypothetical protein